jgi:hypothetical protein
MRTITATYNRSSKWNIPKKLKLLSEEENIKAKGKNIPFSWCINWDTFCYIDENGEEQELDAEYKVCLEDFDRPDDIVEQEESDEEEEEEEVKVEVKKPLRRKRIKKCDKSK